MIKSYRFCYMGVMENEDVDIKWLWRSTCENNSNDVSALTRN